MRIYPTYLALFACGCIAGAWLVERNTALQGWLIVAGLILLTAAVMTQVCHK